MIRIFFSFLEIHTASDQRFQIYEYDNTQSHMLILSCGLT